MKAACFAVILVSLVLSSAPTLWGQEGQGPVSPKAQPQNQKQEGLKKDFQTFNLGELYVTGERLPTAQQVTQTMEITAEEIEATNSKTVAEALSYVNGVKVTAGRKNEPNVQIHGIDQARTLILIDGVPYYETNYGKLDLNVLPVDNIAKIEVQKGVSSVLYGPNGLAGVINIITKKPTEKPAISALVETGDYRQNRVSVSHGMKVGKFNYWLNYSREESKGWYMSRDFDPRLGAVRKVPGGTVMAILEDGGVRDNSATKTDAFWAKVGVEPTPGSEYYLNFHYISKDKESPASLGTIMNNQVNFNRPAFSQFVRIPTYDNWGLDLSGQQKLGDRVTLKAKLFYHDHVDDYESYTNQFYTNQLSVSRFKDNTLGGSFLSDIKVAAIDTLRLSFNYRRDSHKERADEYLPFAESVSYTGSVGVENELNLTKNFSLVAGLSHDWFDVTSAEKNNTNAAGNLTNQIVRSPGYMSEFNPMLGATYTFTDGTRLFGSLARKVRFPTLQSLFSGNSNPPGNPYLKPETSWNYVLGVSRGLTQYAKGEFSFFCHDITDFISRDTPTPDSSYRNFGKILMYGLEVSGEVYPAKDLSFRAGYTYNNASDRSPGHLTDRVQYVPAHQFDLTGKYLIPVVNTTLSMTALYVGQAWGQLATPARPTNLAIETGDYFVVNARIAKTLWKGVEAYFAVNNLFDKNYQPEIDFPAPGRNMFLGLKASY